MVSKDMFALGNTKSCIRELFAFGQQQAAAVGSENVFDFSIGNPSIPSPKEVQEAIADILSSHDPILVHGYTSAAGDDECREAIAQSLNRRYGCRLTKRNLFLTCGAAPALLSCFKGLLASPQSEFIAIAPFFPEYKVFVEAAGGTLVIIPADLERFQIDFDALEQAINHNTQAVIINSPNNPSGVVYTEETIRRLARLLREKAARLGHEIYLITDEPYRELVYGGIELPFVPDYYENTIMCYSYSKSLSLPGERIGYVMVPDDVSDFDFVCDAISGAARAIGHVCAPSLMQRVAAACCDVAPDVSVYEQNARRLYSAMTEMGYRCARPDGAFYLFFEAPHGMSGKRFSDLAKTRHNLLLVPGGDFGCPSHLRLSYCVPPQRIEMALPLLRDLIENPEKQP